MALVTTPGLSTSDAYVSLEDFKSYCDARGHTYPEDDTAIEQAIRRATAWLDATYRDRFPGQPTNAFQALEWPRDGAVYRGEGLPDDEIPRQIEWATSEAAIRELAAPGGLSPDYVAAERVVREKVGDLEVQYSDNVSGPTAMQPVAPVIDGILGALLKRRVGSSVDLLRV